MINFKLTLFTLLELESCLNQALQSEVYLSNLDSTQANELALLLRELLHQMFLEGEDFIAS